MTSPYPWNRGVTESDPLNGNTCGIGVNGDIFTFFARSCDMYIVFLKTMQKLLFGCYYELVNIEMLSARL